MKQIPNTASDDRAQARIAAHCAQDSAARCTTDILKIVTRALADWLSREHVDFAAVRATVEERLRAEFAAAHERMRDDSEGAP